MLGRGVNSTNLVGARFHVQQHGRTPGFERHQFTDLFSHPRVIHEQVARWWQLRTSRIGKEFTEFIEGLGLEIEIFQFGFQFNKVY